MNTASFDFTNPAIESFGPVTAPNGTFHLFGIGGEASVVVHGTDCTINVASFDTTQPFSVTYYDDNGNPQTSTPTITEAQIAPVSVFSGLAAKDHLVTVRYANGTPYVETSGFLSVSSSDTPSVRAPGANDGMGYGTVYDAPTLSAAAGVQLEGGFSLTNALLQANTPDAKIRFRATCGSIKIYALLEGDAYSLDVDDTHVLDVALPNTGSYGWVTIATGLDATTEHQYGLSWTGTNASHFTQVFDLMLLGGTGLATATLPARPVLTGYGDSITYAVTNQLDFCSSDGHIYRLGLAAKRNVWNLGIGGSTVNTSGMTDGRCNAVIATGAADVLILYGTNDGSGIGAVAEADYQTMLQKITAGLPNATVRCLGIIPRGIRTEANTLQANANIQAAVAAIGSGKVSYVETAGWNLSGATYGADFTTNYLSIAQDGVGQTHPNATGYGIFVANLGPLYGVSAGAPVITSAAAVTFTKGTPGTFQLTATGAAPINWSAVGLPAGCTLSTAGLLSYDGS